MCTLWEACCRDKPLQISNASASHGNRSVVAVLPSRPLSARLLTALQTHQQNSYFSFPTQPSTKTHLWLHSYIHHKFPHMIWVQRSDCRSLDLSTMRRGWVEHKYTPPFPLSISNLRQIRKKRSLVYSVLPSPSIQVITAISSYAQMLEVTAPAFLDSRSNSA